MVGDRQGKSDSPKTLPLAAIFLPRQPTSDTLSVPWAQITAVRISNCYNAMGLNERFLTPAFNFSLEKDLVMELKVTRDQLEKKCVTRFFSVHITLREGKIHVFNRCSSKAHYGTGTGLQR